MVVSFGDGVNFVIVLHQVWKKHPVHQDFLGFYVVDSHRMSAQTHGLLGTQCSDCRLLSLTEPPEIECTKPCSHPVPASQHAHAAFASILKGSCPRHHGNRQRLTANVFIPRPILPPL